MRSLHTMAVLQAYQADLLKDLNHGEGLGIEKVKKIQLSHILSPLANQADGSCRNGSMAAMVVTVAQPKRKRHGLSPYAPISPSGLFGNSVNTAVDRYQLAAFKALIPRSSGL